MAKRKRIRLVVKCAAGLLVLAVVGIVGRFAYERARHEYVMGRVLAAGGTYASGGLFLSHELWLDESLTGPLPEAELVHIFERQVRNPYLRSVVLSGHQVTPSIAEALSRTRAYQLGMRLSELDSETAERLVEGGFRYYWCEDAAADLIEQAMHRLGYGGRIYVAGETRYVELSWKRKRAPVEWRTWRKFGPMLDGDPPRVEMAVPSNP